MIISVAVEKLARSEFAKIRSRQEALQTIYLNLLDIFYHPIFVFFQKRRLFQQPPLFSTVIWKLASFRLARWSQWVDATLDSNRLALKTKAKSAG